MQFSRANKISYRRLQARSVALDFNTFTGQQILYTILLAFVILFFVVLYVISINNLSLKGYEIKEAEKLSLQLFEENQRLKIDMVKMQSPDNLKKLSRNMDLEEIKNANYAVFGTPAVARSNSYNP